MQIGFTSWVCVALFISQFSLDNSVSAQSHTPPDEAAIKRAATEAERAWLEQEIGRFSSGAVAVFAGDLKVTQRDPKSITVVDGAALAALSLGPPHSLTISFSNPERWLRLTQDPGTPDVTKVTRLRAFTANEGVSATCAGCVVALADHGEDVLFLRLAARGTLLDARGSRFTVEVAGSLRRVPPKTLRLEQIALLSPDFEAWRSRPEAPFTPQGSEAVRNVETVLRQRAMSPDGDTVRYSCHHETRYRAQHYTDLDNLAGFGVRDLALGATQLCCVDHALHDGSKLCTKEDRE